jgi:hypothetical protein
MGSRHGRKALLVRDFGIRCSGPSSAVFRIGTRRLVLSFALNTAPSSLKVNINGRHSIEVMPEQTSTGRVDQDVTSCPEGKVGERLLSIQLSPAAPSESGLGVGSGADSDVGSDYLQEQRGVQLTEQVSGGRTCRRAWP